MEWTCQYSRQGRCEFVHEDQAFPLPRNFSEVPPRDISISRIYDEIAVTTEKRDADEHRRIIQTAFCPHAWEF